MRFVALTVATIVPFLNVCVFSERFLKVTDTRFESGLM